MSHQLWSTHLLTTCHMKVYGNLLFKRGSVLRYMFIGLMVSYLAIKINFLSLYWYRFGTPLIHCNTWLHDTLYAYKLFVSKTGVIIGKTTPKCLKHFNDRLEYQSFCNSICFVRLVMSDTLLFVKSGWRKIN